MRRPVKTLHREALLPSNDTTNLNANKILHYNGSAWLIVNNLSGGSDEYYLNGIWGTASGDVYVVGYINHGPFDDEGIILHYGNELRTI